MDERYSLTRAPLFVFDLFCLPLLKFAYPFLSPTARHLLRRGDELSEFLEVPDRFFFYSVFWPVSEGTVRQKSNFKFELHLSASARFVFVLSPFAFSFVLTPSFKSLIGFCTSGFFFYGAWRPGFDSLDFCLVSSAESAP